jgi:hypothetical protein
MLDSPGCLLVSANLKDVLSLKLQKVGNILKYLDHLAVFHAFAGLLPSLLYPCFLGL